VEGVVRTFIAFLILVAIAGAIGPAGAAETTFRLSTADELKAVCQKVNGKFSQDQSGYGCGTDCHGQPGTACTVFCKTGAKCYAQVDGARRPKDALSALQAPAWRKR
jgi:hypothetical protein